MTGLVIAVVLGLAVLAGSYAQRYLRVPAPWVWLAVGAALSFVPGLHDVTLPPEVMLFLFLPALLYWESLNISLQMIRRNLRVILLLSVGLVFVTAASIAGLAHLVGLALPAAIVLGAILAPTDATAVATMAPRLPRRTSTILRAESLVNDAAALALYTVAVAAIVAGRDVMPLEISLRFVWAVVGGVLAGLVVGYLLFLLRRVGRRAVIDDTLSVVSPFALYLGGEVILASGVVAVVTGGLLLARLTPSVIPAESRAQTFDFWRVATYVINGALFVLIGLQARSVLETFTRDGWLGVLGLGLLCSVALVAVRFLWNVIITAVIRALDRRPSQRERRAPFGTRLVTVWAGFRGAVSLAAALAIPLATDAGRRIPERSTIIAVTFVVIVFTIVVQGAIMPVVVRRARLQDDPAEAEERRLAATEPLQDALRHLDEDADRLVVSTEARGHVRDLLEHHLEVARRTGSDPDAEADPWTAKQELMQAVVERKRAAVIRLRDQGRIDDGILMEVQQRLDIEELRLQAERAARPAATTSRTDAHAQPVERDDSTAEAAPTEDPTRTSTTG